MVLKVCRETEDLGSILGGELHIDFFFNLVEKTDFLIVKNLFMLRKWHRQFTNRTTAENPPEE